MKRTIEIGITGEKTPQLFAEFVAYRTTKGKASWSLKVAKKSEHRQNLAEIDDTLPWMQDWIINGRLPDGRYIKE